MNMKLSELFVLLLVLVPVVRAVNILILQIDTTSIKNEIFDKIDEASAKHAVAAINYHFALSQGFDYYHVEQLLNQSYVKQKYGSLPPASSSRGFDPVTKKFVPDGIATLPLLWNVTVEVHELRSFDWILYLDSNTILSASHTMFKQTFLESVHGWLSSTPEHPGLQVAPGLMYFQDNDSIDDVCKHSGPILIKPSIHTMRQLRDCWLINTNSQKVETLSSTNIAVKVHTKNWCSGDGWLCRLDTDFTANKAAVLGTRLASLPHVNKLVELVVKKRSSSVDAVQVAEALYEFQSTHLKKAEAQGQHTRRFSQDTPLVSLLHRVEPPDVVKSDSEFVDGVGVESNHRQAATIKYMKSIEKAVGVSDNSSHPCQQQCAALLRAFRFGSIHKEAFDSRMEQITNAIGC